MTVNFEYLNQIGDISKKLDLLIKSFENRTNKRWLSTKELSIYLDYSQDRIHKLKGTEFVEGVHFHKTSGKLLFDIEQIDNWVMGIKIDQESDTINVEDKVNEILDDVLTFK